MRWKSKPKSAAWFAWRPVLTEEGVWVWLEKVARHWRFNDVYEGGYVYRLPARESQTPAPVGREP